MALSHFFSIGMEEPVYDHPPKVNAYAQVKQRNKNIFLGYYHHVSWFGITFFEYAPTSKQNLKPFAVYFPLSNSTRSDDREVLKHNWWKALTLSAKRQFYIKLRNVGTVYRLPASA